ncbi:MAG: nucleotide exchange factor GrpE [Spirochaetes bacterium GWF1_41_5]|nr:MAG: nucleotide exchange factor GrpE [Spirochaetes bacterium GWF1_41_5]HBE03151.1 nucleotide exchange factor GrpE [Spirochaetia bacterium]
MENENFSETSGTGRKNETREFADIIKENTVKFAEETGELLDQALAGLNREISAVKDRFRSSVLETAHAYRQKNENDWRFSLINDFSAWLYELSDEEYNSFPDGKDNPPDGESEIPDYMTLLRHFIVLRHEVRNQSEITLETGKNFTAEMQSARDALAHQENRLAQLVLDLKSEIPRARREGEEKIIHELLNIYDDISSLAEESAFLESVKPGWFSRKNNNLERIIQNQNNTLNKIRDALEKLKIAPVCRIGDRFDPARMRAAGTTFNPDFNNEAVIKIFRQGYIKEGNILRLAEVEINKKE